MTPGTTLGRYRVIGELGRGGAGVVWEAEEPESGRRVAIKQLLSREAELLLRFRREGELLARVRHRGLVPVHELLLLPDGPALVMERIDGRRLADLSPEEKTPERAARIVRELADALEALHRAGILHRDLKPDNALLRADGQPVLIDLGLGVAADVDRLTRTGEVMGTPSFMAPEQALGEATDARTDVFGLGGVLAWLLTGQATFGVGPPLAVLHRASSGQHQLGSLSHVEPALRAILLRALARVPVDRWPSAAALRDALDRWLAGERPRARRGPLVAGLGVLAAAAAGGTALLSAPPPETAPLPASAPAVSATPSSVPPAPVVSAAAAAPASASPSQVPSRPVPLDERLRAWPRRGEVIRSTLRWAEVYRRAYPRKEDGLSPAEREEIESDLARRRAAWSLELSTELVAERPDGVSRLRSRIERAVLAWDPGQGVAQWEVPVSELVESCFTWAVGPSGELLELDPAPLDGALARVAESAPQLAPPARTLPAQLRLGLELTHHLWDGSPPASAPWSVGPPGERQRHFVSGSARDGLLVLLARLEPMRTALPLIPLVLEPEAAREGRPTINGKVWLGSGRVAQVSVVQKHRLGQRQLQPGTYRLLWESCFVWVRAGTSEAPEEAEGD